MSPFNLRPSSMSRPWSVLVGTLAISACAAEPGANSPEAESTFAQPSIADVLDPSVSYGETLRGYSTYIALGDSYSSANGVTNNGPVCFAGDGAWPYLLKPRLPLQQPGNPVLSSACSGATTQGILGAEQGMAPQIDTVKALAPELLVSALITITIGGNDVDVANELLECMAYDCTQNEGRILDNIAATRLKLDATFKALRAAAPKATIVAVGYPHIVAKTADVPCNDGVEEIDLAERTMIRGAIDVMNAQIAAAAKNAQINWVVDEVVAAFEGREACSGAGELIHSVTPTTPGGALFHPNAAGNRAYAEAVFKGLSAQVPSAPVVTRPIAPSTPAASAPAATSGLTTPSSATTPARSATPTPAPASTAGPKPTATNKPTSGSARGAGDSETEGESGGESDPDDEPEGAPGAEDEAEGGDSSVDEDGARAEDGALGEGDGEGAFDPGDEDGAQTDDGWDLGDDGQEDDGWDLEYDT